MGAHAAGADTAAQRELPVFVQGNILDQIDHVGGRRCNNRWPCRPALFRLVAGPTHFVFQANAVFPDITDGTDDDRAAGALVLDREGRDGDGSHLDARSADPNRRPGPGTSLHRPLQVSKAQAPRRLPRRSSEFSLFPRLNDRRAGSPRQISSETNTWLITAIGRKVSIATAPLEPRLDRFSRFYPSAVTVAATGEQRPILPFASPKAEGIAARQHVKSSFLLANFLLPAPPATASRGVTWKRPSQACSRRPAGHGFEIAEIHNMNQGHEAQSAFAAAKSAPRQSGNHGKAVGEKRMVECLLRRTRRGSDLRPIPGPARCGFPGRPAPIAPGRSLASPPRHPAHRAGPRDSAGRWRSGCGRCRSRSPPAAGRAEGQAPAIRAVAPEKIIFPCEIIDIALAPIDAVHQPGMAAAAQQRGRRA